MKHNKIFVTSKIIPWLHVLILTSIGLVMAWISWRKWPDVLVDFGRELYVPWRLNQGAVLYRDIFHLYGPFSDYFNALLFRIFGTILITIAFFNIILLGVITCLIFRIFLYITDRSTSLITTASFLSIFAFSQYVGIGNYNFVCPYSHEVTHGILLTLIAMYLFILYLRRNTAVKITVIGVCLGLVFLTKAEVFIAALSAFIVGFASLFRSRNCTFQIKVRIVRNLLLGFASIVIVSVIFMAKAIGITSAFKNIVILQYAAIFTPLAGNLFYRQIMGIDRPFFNINKMLDASFLYIIILISSTILAYLLSRLSKIIRNILLFALLFGLFLLFPRISGLVKWPDFFRAVPVFLIFLIIILCNLYFKKASNRLLAAIVFAFFALLLLWKMIFNVHVFHYGFALAMPAVLILLAAFIYFVPIVVNMKLKRTLIPHRAINALCVIAILYVHILWSCNIFAFKTYPVGSGGDMILDWDSRVSNRGACVNAALGRINKIMQPSDTFAVVPRGDMINYMSRHPNPVPCFEYNPNLVDMIGEDALMASFKRHAPDYIIVTDVDTSEFGARFFGRDYCQKLWTWIDKNYSTVEQIGQAPLTGTGFGILIKKRCSYSENLISTEVCPNS